MKNILILLVAIGLVTTTSILSCDESTQNGEIAENNLRDSARIKDSINTEYMTDMANFRKQTDDKIADNNKSIADFKARIKNEKSQAKADYDTRIAGLEQKNSDMKMRMDDYKAEGKEKWEIFKTEFSHGMEE